MKYRLLVLLLFLTLFCFLKLNRKQNQIFLPIQTLTKYSKNDVSGSGRYYVIDSLSEIPKMITFKEYLKDLEKGGEILTEKTKNSTVPVEQNIATLITKYEFLVDNKFSHYGVEIFNFIKIKGKFQTQYLQ